MKKLVLFNLFLFLLLSSFAKQGYLGIVVSDLPAQTKGVHVDEVIRNSAAEAFGLRSNDIITAVNDVAVEKKEQLVSLLSGKTYGELVKVDYVRNGRLESERISLGNQPQPVTVKVNKETKSDGDHWIFADYNVEIVMSASSSTPSAVFIKNDKGVATATRNIRAVAQQLEWIDKIKNQKHICNCNCPISQYTYYKIDREAPAADANSSISNTLFADKFTLTPNPSTGKLKVDLASNEIGTPSLTIFDVNGEVVQTDMLQNFVGEYSKEYSLDRLAKGTYMMQLKIGDKLTTKKFVLQ
jgi:membrane-associated protease RseP (regulator of RpoE activity)